MSQSGLICNFILLLFPYKTQNLAALQNSIICRSLLKETIPSLLNQAYADETEIIFVDDNSSDNSVGIIKEFAQQHSRIRLIENSENRGPSIRLNQGAKAAKGKYFLLIDGDDLLFENAVNILLEVIQKKDADFVYAKRKQLKSCKSETCSNKYAYVVSDDPLQYLLSNRKLVNMASLVNADLYRKLGGCDERVFIQDESLPIRLGYKAKRMVDLKLQIVGVLPIDHIVTAVRLSSNNLQSFHDRFFAYYNFLIENKDISKKNRELIYGRCLRVFG